MNNNELKAKVIEICKITYGFAPAKKHVVLLEASGDGEYVLFSILNPKNEKIIYNITDRQLSICPKKER